jgi:hypothetical protein
MLPDDVEERIRAFQESRAIFTALELDMFTAAGEGATASEVAAKMGTDSRATEMLLTALAAMGLLVKQQGIFRNTPLARRYFTGASPDNALPAWLHTAHLSQRWTHLTGCVTARHGCGTRRDRRSWRGVDRGVHRGNASQCHGAPDPLQCLQIRKYEKRVK